ncbi:MAG: glycoside hydrolase family 44 protein, partial [Kiritimatiellaeota bacterium]|nr:glycoside hydrolase family 44 protein [Kiritimatiellota bacterium]
MKKPLIFALLALSALAQQTATVTINTGKVLHKVAGREYHGVNLVALWNDTGTVAETKRAYEQMGMGLVRFPGGVPCQWYDWKEPLASGWTTQTPQTAWEFAKAGHSKMVFQTNTATDQSTDKDGKKYSFNSSGEHAAAWVAAMKKANVGVAFWEIGNEPEMDAPKEFKDKGQAAIYEWYNAKYAEQVKAIRKADPKARVMGPSATNTWFWWAEGNLAKFLKAHGNRGGSGLADAISLHWYPGGGDAPWENKRGIVQGEWPKAMDFIRKTIREHDSRDLPVYITEWNWGAGDKNESGSEFANALGVADTVGMFLRTGVAGHNFFCLQRVKRNWGVLAMR